MTYQENLKKAQGWGEPQLLREDWIIKRYAPDGSIKEATFSGQEEAQIVMRLFRDFDLEGHFELVCRPRAEDVVVTSYRNEPEEEPLDHLVKPLEGEPLSEPLERESDKFDRERSYRDSEGDIWTYLYGGGDRYPGWYFQEREGGPHYGTFDAPLLGPHEEVKGEEEVIIDPRDLLRSKQYLDNDGCVWGFRTHQGSDMPRWHWRLEESPAWDPHQFPRPVDGPWTEYKEED